MNSSSFFSRLRGKIRTRWQSHSTFARVMIVCLCVGISVVVIAIGLSMSRSVRTAPKVIEKHIYGEEIGLNGLRYKHGAHIYDPETGKILVDSIEWLHIASGDTIAILAKNHRRAFINLNNAELITPLDYERAWQYSCDRGIMARHDSLFIFRRDGSQVNAEGIKVQSQYEHQFYNNTMVLNVGYKRVGLMDTAGLWVLEPKYTKIEVNYNRRLYNTSLDDQCIVYDFEMKPVLRGAFKSIEVDWSEGLIATEHNGIQRLFDYSGKLVYQVIYKRIEELAYNTGRTDKDGKEIFEDTDCYVYVDYNNKRGLMDKHYHVLTPPLFHTIEAQTRHVFFASFGEYSERFGTLIDDHGKALR